jgi:PAS domain S-box-containing protein
MIVPSLEAVPAAVFSTRKLLGYTRAFAERFFPDPSGKPPSLTLNTFLGNRNVNFARDIRALRIDASLEREARLDTRKGEQSFRVSASVSTLEGERSVTLILQDVHDYVMSIRALEESEMRARVLVETRSAAIALIRKGKFVYVNKGYLELFGYLLREDLIDKDVTTVVAGREKKNIAERLQREVAAGAAIERFEFTGVRKDRSRVNVQVLEELIDLDGEPTLLWYHVDVTHLRSAQEDVVRERRENEVLDNILETLHKSVDRSVLVPGSLHAVLRWFSYESGCVLMLDDAGTGFVLEHAENLSDKLQNALRGLNMKEGLGGFLVKTMEPVRFTIEEYPPYLPHKALFEAEGIKRIICLPLSGSEGVVGIAILLSQRTVESEDTHASFLPTVARHLGFALDKAVRHQATSRRADDFQTALESLSDAVYETAPNGNYRHCSPAIERLTGYKVREITATSDAWRAMVHPDDRSLLSERISRQAGQEQEFVLEYRILPKGKAAYRWVRDAVRYRRDENGAVLSIHGIVSDITASKTEELELRRAEQVLRGIVDAMGDALMMTDLEAKILDVNSAFSAVTGYSRAEALGQVLPYPWLHEDQMATFVQWLNTLRETKKVSDFDMHWLRRDGSEIAISMSTTLLRGASGEPVAILNLARDINERQRQGEEIRQTNRQLALLSAIGQGLAGALDTQTVLAVLHEQMREPLSYGQISYHEYNREANVLMPVFEAGGESADVVTGGSRDMLPLGDFPVLARVVSTQEPWSGEEDGKSALVIPIVSKERLLGLLRLSRQQENPFEETDLRIVASIGNLVAIALDRVALHDETVASAREIAFRNEELDRFTYVVSHDLKEPLITINGYTRLALDGGGARMSEEVRQHLDSVMRASVRMKQLIDDLLTLSRVGREQGQPAVVSVGRVLSDLVHDLEFMLHERNARVEYPEELPSVRYDPTHLSMVFRNLIVNGVKYNQHDERVVRIAARKAGGMWEFSVSDNGMGIDVRDFEKIFTIFQRLDPADGAGGTGAGLTIVKKIVESNGGTIRLESEQGTGSTFTFTIPDHG